MTKRVYARPMLNSMGKITVQYYLLGIIRYIIIEKGQVIVVFGHPGFPMSINRARGKSCPGKETEIGL